MLTKKIDIGKISNNSKQKGNIWVAVAIVVAALIVAGAVIYSRGEGGADTTNNVPIRTADGYGDLESVRVAQSDDHIVGNTDAAVTIVEFSDTECPFCATLHEVLNQVVKEYEPDQVAWVYRHLPLTQLHSKAVVEAHATECAAELGGNDIFWNYINTLYATTPSNNKLDLAELPKIAEQVGLDKGAFEECMESERHLDEIEADFREGVAAAGDNLGTPFSLVIFSDGSRIPISGIRSGSSVEEQAANEHAKWKEIIDAYLTL